MAGGSGPRQPAQTLAQATLILCPVAIIRAHGPNSLLLLKHVLQALPGIVKLPFDRAWRAIQRLGDGFDAQFLIIVKDHDGSLAGGSASRA